MNKNSITVAKTTGMSKLVRPRFGPGMLLQHDDLEQLGTYTRELSRLMFQSLFGCGVICGLVVDTEEKCGKVVVKVGAGLALGCSGDPIHVPKDQQFTLDDNCDGELPPRLWVVLCAVAKCCAPRTSMCASDEDDGTAVCTREREGFEIRVDRQRPECACGCPEPLAENTERPDESGCQCADPESKCYEAHYDGKCGCECDECSDCDCKCVLLARLDREGDTNNWIPDHRVRRFIRPLLMRDPQIAIENERRRQAAAQGGQGQPLPPPPAPAPAPAGGAPAPAPTPATPAPPIDAPVANPQGAVRREAPSATRKRNRKNEPEL